MPTHRLGGVTDEDPVREARRCPCPSSIGGPLGRAPPGQGPSPPPSCGSRTLAARLPERQLGALSGMGVIGRSPRSAHVAQLECSLRHPAQLMSVEGTVGRSDPAPNRVAPADSPKLGCPTTRRHHCPGAPSRRDPNQAPSRRWDTQRRDAVPPHASHSGTCCGSGRRSSRSPCRERWSRGCPFGCRCSVVHGSTSAGRDGRAHRLSSSGQELLRGASGTSDITATARSHLSMHPVSSCAPACTGSSATRCTSRS